MLDENEMRTWEQRSSEHGWSEVVKITGKSRKKYELSITNVEADLNFIIPKTIPLILYPQKFLSVIPYPFNYWSTYPLSLKPLTGPLF